MTRVAIEHWLASRTPVRPVALAARMSQSVASCDDARLAAATTMAAAMGTLGTATLARVNAGAPASPDLALELLAADAFVTYAFEAAAEEHVAALPLVRQLLRDVA